MKRNVFVTIVLILSLVLVACDALPGGGGEGTQDPNATSVAQEDPAATGVPPEPTEQRIPVVIAVQNIPRGVVVTPDRVREVLYPISIVPEDAFQEIDLVVGTIAATDIFINEILLSRKLVQSFDSLGNVGSDAAAILDPSRVAIAVPIDRITSVAYAIQPGDRVDIIVSMLFVDLDQDFQSQLPNTMTIGGYEGGFEFDDNAGQIAVVQNELPPFEGNLATYTFLADEIDTRGYTGQDVFSLTGSSTTTFRDDYIVPVIIQPQEQQRPRLVTQRTVTDAQVLYVGEFPRDGRIFVATSTPVATDVPDETVADTGDGEEGTPIPTALPDRPTIITLAVRPQDAVVLTYMAESSIPMTFALRSARTQGLPDTTPVTLNYILQTYNIQVPERLNFGIEPAIRSIRGITLENIFASGSSSDAENVDSTGEEDAAEGGG